MHFAKKIVSTAASAALVVALCPVTTQLAFASDQVQCEVGGIVYDIYDDGTAAVAEQIKSSGTYSLSGDVVIPETVSANGTSYKVTEISNYAFSKNEVAAPIVSVSIPSSVRRIGMSAFQKCTSLETVQIAEGSQLTVIAARAFGECGKLKGMTIPYTVYKIGSFAFQECPSLEYFTFESTPAGKTEVNLGIDEGALSNAGRQPSKLAELTLPARLLNVPMNFCEYQDGLKKVVCQGSLSQIGYQSFQYCTSMEYFEFPTLTAESSRVASMAFRGTMSMKTLVFRGDENFGLSNSSFGSTWGGVGSNTSTNFVAPDVETIIYYGTHTSNIFANAKKYNNINFYSSADAARASLEEGADTSKDLVGSARIRSDMLFGQVSSTMAASDDNGAVIFDDGGAVPELASGTSWYFSGKTHTDAVTNAAVAGVSNNNDITQGNIVIDGGDEFAYCAEPIDVQLQLYDVTGDLVAPEHYRTYLTDESGNVLEVAQEIGTYQVHVEALESGSAYTGATYKTITIIAATAVWKRMSGDVKNGTINHVDEAFFAEDGVERLVIVREGATFLGAAACGMAGAMEAPVVYSKTTGLSSEAVRYLRLYKPESVYLVGFGSNSATIKEDILSSAAASVTVTAVFDDDTEAATAANLYSKTSVLDIWDESKTAVVIGTSNVAAAGSAASLAYTLKAPVFLMGQDGSLDEKVVKALSGFEKVVIAGATEGQLNASWIQGLENAPVTLASSEADPFHASLEVAEYEVQEGIANWKSLGVTSAAGWYGENCFVAAASMGKGSTPLLFVGDSKSQEDLLMELLTEKRYKVLNGYLISTRRYLSDELRESIEALWAVEDEYDIRNCTVSVAGTSFALDKLESDLNSKVVSPNGQELLYGVWAIRSAFHNTLAPSDAQYSLEYVDVDTDVSYLANGVSADKQYSLTFCGENEYHGTKTILINVVKPAVVVKPQAITSIALSASSYTYDGKVKKPSVTVKAGSKKLSASDYTVSYSAGCKNVGAYTVKVTGKGNYTGSKTATFTINPQATSVKKLSKVKKGFKVTWKKVAAQCSGYQIAYSTSPSKAADGKLKKAKTVTASGAKKTSKTVTKLKSGKRYYVQVRTFMKVGKKTYFGKWSKVSAVKAK